MLLGIPVNKTIGQIEIEFYLHDSSGQLLKTYSLNSLNQKQSSIYRNTALELPTFTNKVFTHVVSQLRDQILADIELFESRINAGDQ